MCICQVRVHDDDGAIVRVGPASELVHQSDQRRESSPLRRTAGSPRVRNHGASTNKKPRAMLGVVLVEAAGVEPASERPVVAGVYMHSRT